MPRALANASDGPVQGVRREVLRGLAPEDAEAMLRRAGIQGDGGRMRAYLEGEFDCHPLVVGFVAGLVRKAPWAQMSFDRWVDDRRGGQAINLADPDLRQRQTNILSLAFSALTPEARELLARIGMVSSATDLEVLEALNPQRPDPPAELAEPRPPDEQWDYILVEQLGRAKGKRRVRIERDIAERNRARQREYEAARQAHAAYQYELEAWRRSPALRDASAWLHTTLTDLEARGLLQWDREAGSFDLHPVVRGYAISALDPQARDAAGERVADYFSTRTEPDYERATSVRELSDRMQVAQALSVAGQTQRAWDVLQPGTLGALFRLECHHEALALLRPFFPDGWMAPPSGVTDIGTVANQALRAHSSVGRWREAEAQQVFSIRDSMGKGLSRDLSAHIRNHSLGALGRNERARAARILGLSRDIGAVLELDDRILWCDVSRELDSTSRGALDEARQLWTDLISRPAWQHRDPQLETQCLTTEGYLLWRENDLTTVWLEAAFDRVRILGYQWPERRLLRLAGEWHLASGDDEAAIVAFDEAIAMARAVGLDDTRSEALRGLSLARLGLREQAEATAALAERVPDHVALAELYLALAELYLALDLPQKAREHALVGYRWGWADGPPWCHHWALQTGRAVLAALGEPEPQLPPFDPTRIRTIEYEADIRRLIEEHAAKQF
jgi:hypothetical protein